MPKNTQKEALSLSIGKDGKWRLYHSEGRFMLEMDSFHIQTHGSLLYPFCIKEGESFIALTRKEAAKLTVEWIRYITLRQGEDIDIEVSTVGFNASISAKGTHP